MPMESVGSSEVMIMHVYRYIVVLSLTTSNYTWMILTAHMIFLADFEYVFKKNIL